MCSPQSRSQCGTGRGRLPVASAERISVEIEARNRRRIGDSLSISQRRDRAIPPYGGKVGGVFQQPLRMESMDGGTRRRRNRPSLLLSSATRGRRNLGRLA